MAKRLSKSLETLEKGNISTSKFYRLLEIKNEFKDFIWQYEELQELSTEDIEMARESKNECEQVLYELKILLREASKILSTSVIQNYDTKDITLGSIYKWHHAGKQEILYLVQWVFPKCGPDQCGFRCSAVYFSGQNSLSAVWKNSQQCGFF